jgi:DNA-directed RNA polymerase subunit RPC12/RpoP
MRIESCRKCGTELEWIQERQQRCPECDIIITH